MDIIPINIPLELPASLLFLKILLVATFLIHIVFINFMIGGTFWTVFMRMLSKEDPFWERVAKDIGNTVTVNKSIAVVLGIGPLLAISLAYTNFFYTVINIIAPAWLSVIWLVALAFLALYVYKYSWDSSKYSLRFKYFWGLLACAIFLVVPLIFLTNINLMLYPDQWKNIYTFWQAIWVPNVIPRYLHFMNASFAITGLFAYGYFHYKGYNKSDEEEEYYTRAKRLGLKWALVATVLQMIFGMLNYVTLPMIADSTLVLILIIAAVIFAGIAIYLMSIELYTDKYVNHFFIFISVFLIICFMATLRHVVRENALREPQNILANKTNIYQTKLASFLKTYTPTGEIKVTGESIFQEVCMTCHALDRKVVGPPMQYAINKYKNNPQAMISFVKNPKKINKDFPVMPRPPISDAEIEMVVDYLLKLEVGKNE